MIDQVVELMGFIGSLTNVFAEEIKVYPAHKDLLSNVYSILSEIEADDKENIIPASFQQNLQNILSDIKGTIYSLCKSSQSGNTILIHPIDEEMLNTAESRFERIRQAYYFYKRLGFATRNTVIVGANGSGKTTLANALKETMHKDTGIVIPAQKLLIIPTFGNTPSYKTSQDNFAKFQSKVFDDKITYDINKDNDVPYQITRELGSDFRDVLGLLLAERSAIRNQYCDLIQKGEQPSPESLRCCLDEVIEIWNFLIEHRHLFCDNEGRLSLRSADGIYPAHMMSDGEREILYLAGRVLLSRPKSLIVVDEPEIYLHPLIVNKLWDILENKRKDCVFFYLTHDLEFASTRIAQKAWITNFNYPSTWDIELIEGEKLPPELLLRLVGSRKKILFCEGIKGNADSQIYEILFPNLTIQPVESCRNVINYTRSFNNIPNTTVAALGIIDRDLRSQEQLLKLANNSVYSFDVAEIENLLLDESFLGYYSEYKHENIDIAALKERLFKKAKSEIEQQVSAYLSAWLNFQFSEIKVKGGNSPEAVKQNYQNLIESINLDSLQTERKLLLNTIIEEQDYQQLLKYWNNKGMLQEITGMLKLKDRRTYIDKAIKVLREYQPARKALLSYFPADLIKQNLGDATGSPELS